MSQDDVLECEVRSRVAHLLGLHHLRLQVSSARAGHWRGTGGHFLIPRDTERRPLLPNPKGFIIGEA